MFDDAVSYMKLLSLLSIWKSSCLPPVSLRLMVTHAAQVQDEAVSLVEAVPADRHLRRPDNSPTFDL